MKRYLLIGALSLGGLLIATPLSTAEASESCTQSEQVLNNTVKKLNKKKPAKKAAPSKPLRKNGTVKKVTTTDVVQNCQDREVKVQEDEKEEQAQIGVIKDMDSTKQTVAKKPDPNRIYEAVDEQASFKGGQSALMQWLGAHIKYPDEAKKNAIEGRVVVKFTVEKDGSITNVMVFRSADEVLNREAIRVASLMPKWNPGKNNGVEVRSWFYLPLVFKFEH